MKMKIGALRPLALFVPPLLLACAGAATSPGGPAASRAPAAGIRIENAPVVDAAAQVAERTGSAYLLDPSLEGRVTLVAPSSFTPGQLGDLFRGALHDLGYEAAPVGSAYRVTRRAGSPSTAAPPPAAQSIMSAASLKGVTRAAETGDADTVRRFLAAGGDPNAVAPGDDRPLIARAATAGHLDVVRTLVEGGAEPDFGGGSPPLFRAVQARRADVVRYLLEKGANVDNPAWAETRILADACQIPDAGLVRLLVEHGADIHAVNRDGAGALYLCARSGAAEAVRFLLERGADPNGIGAALPLLGAVMKGDRETAALLRERGADPSRALLELPSLGGREMKPALDMLLDLGADLKSRGLEGETPLLRAAQRGMVDLMRLLLERGADVQARDFLGRTALHRLLSGRGEREEPALVLLEAGAEVDAADGRGGTPLMAAVRSGQGEAVLLLLRRGADARRADGDGNTALHFAAMSGNRKLVAYLRDAGGRLDERNVDGASPLDLAQPQLRAELGRAGTADPPSPAGNPPAGGPVAGRPAPGLLAAAVARGDVQAVRSFLGAGGNPNIEGQPPSGSREPPLVTAAGKGDLAIVTALVEAGAALNLFGGEGGDTALVRAAKQEQREVARYLLEKGADVRPLRNGDSAVAALAALGDAELVRTAVERGGDPQAPASSRQRPIHFAAEKGRVEVLQYLLKSGVNPNPRDPGTLSPLALAAKKGGAKAVEALFAGGADAGRALLELAGDRGVSSEALELILALNPDLGVRDAEGNTSLLRLVRLGEKASYVSILLERGADARARSWSGRSALHFAADPPNGSAVVPALLKSGCPLDGRDARGATPLMAAAGGRSGGEGRGDAGEKLLALLLERGADLSAADAEGDTPLHYAARAGSLERVTLLLQAGADRLRRNAAGSLAADLVPHGKEALRRALVQPPPPSPPPSGQR